VRSSNITAGINPFNSSSSAVASSISALSTVPIHKPVNGQSALLLYQQQRNRQAIFTGIQALDRVLGDGIKLGELIEFCGVPGIGKTQLCMQLSVNVQIPTKFGGCEGEAILIDSEGSFSASRCASIAEGLVEHIQRIQGNRGLPNSNNNNPSPVQLTVESILRRIHVFRVFDHTEQLALFGSLETFLASHPNIRLIIVDSIAFHFRRGFGGDFSSRSRILLNMASSLAALASKFKLAIVLSNHVTTKIERKITTKINNQENSLYSEDGANHMMQETSHLSPALGESWAHACATRVLLYWNNRVRAAKLLKSSSKLTASCLYMVSEKGVRDLPSTTSSSTSSPLRDGTNKRARDLSADRSTFSNSIDMSVKRSQPFNI
jgi:RAD51-like protein 2